MAQEESIGFFGENQNGYEVHNHKFPVDIEPPTPPTKWRFAVLKDALDSWNNQTKLMDSDQKEYMLTTKLMRDNNTYDITAEDIGQDKIRLENYATWKTKGTLYTQRYDSQGQKWSANFMVPPMSADAELDGFADFKYGFEYYLIDGEQNLTIPISYGSDAKNLSDYAKKEHVKQIKSTLFINDELVDSVEDVEKLSIQKDFDYEFIKFQNEGIITLNIKVQSTLLTKFTTDGALVDIKNYVLTIYLSPQEASGDEIEEILDEKEEKLPQDDYIEANTKYKYVRDDSYAKFKDIPPPYIDSIEVSIIKNGKENQLPKVKNTGKEFVCAGQTITIKATVGNAPANVTLEFEGNNSITKFDTITKKFEWDEPKSRKISTFLPTLKAFEQMYSGRVIMKEGNSVDDNLIEYTYTYIIPYETKQTLNSWATLRNDTKDAFSIDENKIFTRRTSPYQIVVKAKSETGIDTARYSLDVFERWDTIYNRDISKYLVKDYSNIFN